MTAATLIATPITSTVRATSATSRATTSHAARVGRSPHPQCCDDPGDAADIEEAEPERLPDGRRVLGRDDGEQGDHQHDRHEAGFDDRPKPGHTRDHVSPGCLPVFRRRSGTGNRRPTPFRSGRPPTRASWRSRSTALLLIRAIAGQGVDAPHRIKQVASFGGPKARPGLRMRRWSSANSWGVSSRGAPASAAVYAAGSRWSGPASTGDTVVWGAAISRDGFTQHSSRRKRARTRASSSRLEKGLVR